MRNIVGINSKKNKIGRLPSDDNRIGVRCLFHTLAGCRGSHVFEMKDLGFSVLTD